MRARERNRRFPGFHSVYRLADPVLNAHFRGRMEGDYETLLEVDRGAVIPEEPIPVRHDAGGKPRDVIWTTWGTPVVVSRRVVDLLRASGFTGWATYPVTLYDRDGEFVDGYHGLATTGRCGPIDYSRSAPVAVMSPGGGERMQYRGKYFDPDSWDGSDFFVPTTGFGGRFVVAEVKDCFEDAKIRNVEFERLTDALVSPDTVERYVRELARGDAESAARPS